MPPAGSLDRGEVVERGLRAAVAAPARDEVREGLGRVPDGRPPTKADWSRLSKAWRGRIDALVALRDGLDSCIGCGCLSLGRCRLYNPQDRVSEAGAGARLLPPLLRRTPAHGV